MIRNLLFRFDKLRSVVVRGAKSDPKGDGADLSRCIPSDDTVEQDLAWGHFVGDIQPHLGYSTRE